MNQSYKINKYKVIQNLFNTLTQVQVISISTVKIKLKVMKINLVVVLSKKNY